MTRRRTMPRDYRHTIDIEEPTETIDANGVVIITWTKYAKKLRAKIETVSGGEYYKAQQVASDALTRIKFPYDSSYAGITTKMRVLFGVRTFDVTYAPNFDEENREFILLATERH